MGRVTGIGGVFFRTKDPARTRDWYRDHLGLMTDDYGTNFAWQQRDGAPGYTQWSPFQQDSDYFDGEFMVNYRVEGLDQMLADLRDRGIEVIREEKQPYGRFAHIRDGDGRLIELWEPVDTEYEKILGDGITS